MSSTAHTRQGKNHSGSPDTKTAESTQKAAYGAKGAARMPAWTSAWGDRPAIGLTGPIADLQAKGVLSQSGDPYEQEADQVANQVMRMAAPGSSMTPAPVDPPEAPQRLATSTSVSHVSPIVQRLTAEEDTASPIARESAPASDTTTADSTQTSDTSAEQSAESGTTPDETPTPGLIVDDSTEQLQAGQMKKSDFLAQLRDAVCTTTEEALKGTIWSAAGCPWIDHWFSYYSNRSSQQIERALRRYAPETAKATSASDYIPIICQRLPRDSPAHETLQSFL